MRADRVMTLCEMKFPDRKIGMEVVGPAEQRRQRIHNPKQLTIEQVLITASEPTERLRDEGYFNRILTLPDLLE